MDVILLVALVTCKQDVLIQNVVMPNCGLDDNINWRGLEVKTTLSGLENHHGWD